jgi:hypothetical protein
MFPVKSGKTCLCLQVTKQSRVVADTRTEQLRRKRPAIIFVINCLVAMIQIFIAAIATLTCATMIMNEPPSGDDE